MPRKAPAGATLAALAPLVLAGCIYYDEPDDALARAVRDAGAAQGGIVRAGPRAGWYLVRVWVEELGADAPSPEGPAPGADARLLSSLPARHARARAAGLRMVLCLPSEEPHAAILLRQGRTGFAALARGARVREFEEAGATVGGAEVDRGFVVTVEGDAGRTAVEVVPAFRDPRPGGAETRIERLAVGGALAAGEAFAVDAAPDARDPAVRALFFDPADDRNPARRRRLLLQVEPVR